MTLPSGTVTFLFTDIEGSTRLLHELGDDYAAALAEHRRVLREAFTRHGGVEVDTQGDAFFVAFAKATDALAAAADGRDGLVDGPIRVRMGVHTGEPLLTDEGYVGIDVHRAARIAAVGHGGQILASQSTRELAGAALRDLGEHRLKDLTAPERIYQLGDGDFPPLKSLNATNLPVAASALVGREEELAELQELLRDGARLITLTGPGGSGKTRLGLQVGAELVDDFRGGVFFVPLSGVGQPELVSATINGTIGIRDVGELGDRQALLVIDNFEHLLDAAPAVAELLQAAPRTKVLATSRAPLRIAGEREFPVDPLPDADAVELLTERARAVRPDFAPDETTHELCRRLDYLPLALELAASRLRSIGPDALLERLDRRLPLLTGGRRDAPERQRTLRATIEWSYDLLDASLQEVFARLGVFSTFTLEAAESVARAGFDEIDALVETSLLKPVADGRFLMLETIRELALERLAASGEETEIRERQLEYLTQLGESANLHTEDDGPMRHELVIPERDNVRAALRWGVETGRKVEGLRLAGALENWWITSDPGESVQWLDRLFALDGDTPAEVLQIAYRCLGNAATVVGDPVGEEWYSKSLEAAQSIGDERHIASVLHRLAVWRIHYEDYDGAIRLMEESESLSEALGLDRVLASNLSLRGTIARRRGDLNAALRYSDESREIAHRTGFTWWERVEWQARAVALFGLGRPAEAAESGLEAARIAERMGDRASTVHSLALVARGCAERGDVVAAGRIWGAIEAEQERAPIPAWGVERKELWEPVLAHDGPDFAAGRAAGRTATLVEILEELRSLD